MIELSEAQLKQLTALLSRLPEEVVGNLYLAANRIDGELASLIVKCLDTKESEDIIDRFFAHLLPLSGIPENQPPSLCYAPRPLLEAIWQWVVEELAPELTEELETILDEYDVDDARYDEAFDALRIKVSEILKERLDSTEDDPRNTARICAKLNIKNIDGLANTQAMLRLSPILRDALKDVPEVIAEADEGICYLLREKYDLVVKQDGEAGVWLFFLSMPRFDKPWQLLRVFEAITGRADDLLVSQTDMSHVVDALLSDSEFYLNRVSNVPADRETGISLSQSLANYAAISVGMTRDLGIRKDGDLGKRFYNLRNKASRSMSKIHDGVRNVIETAAYEGVVTRSKRFREDFNQEQAEGCALFLHLSRNDAGRAAVGKAHSELIDEVVEICQRAGDVLLAQLKNSDPKDALEIKTRIEEVSNLLGCLGFQDDATMLLRQSDSVFAA